MCEITDEPLINGHKGPKALTFHSFPSPLRRREKRELIESFLEVVVTTIHHPLPAAITSTPELRLMHRLRLREACHLLYVSNLGKLKLE
ncbi:hypothetical protein PIB30_089452 [Stylosanthes scabra]|uniref:Uncharacterized protein n=1 Tax=Stylosanthes scabra TaxID=79078 RepID=A0ABU6ZSP7_9FABA|nr:hypothetical protein [Stylosanthes scabra]